MSARNLRRADDTKPGRSEARPELGFGLHVRPERIQARWLGTDGAGKATGALRLVDSRLGGLASSGSRQSIGSYRRGSHEAGADGLQRFELNLPVGARAAVEWQFRAVDVHRRRASGLVADRGRVRPSGGRRPWVTHAGERSITGYCNLITDWVAAEAETVTVGEEELQHRPSAHRAHSFRLRGRAPVGQARRRARAARGTGGQWRTTGISPARCPLGRAGASPTQR